MWMSKGEGNDGNAEVIHRGDALMVLGTPWFSSLTTSKMSNFTRKSWEFDCLYFASLQHIMKQQKKNLQCFLKANILCRQLPELLLSCGITLSADRTWTWNNFSLTMWCTLWKWFIQPFLIQYLRVVPVQLSAIINEKISLEFPSSATVHSRRPCSMTESD